MVVPYIECMLRPQTRDIGTRFGAEFANVGSSDTAYHSLLTQLWSVGEGFGLLEHDLAPSDALLSELLACPHEWCAAPYLYAPQGKRILIWGGLGCTKFRESLLRREPDAMARIERCHWEVLDLNLADLLMKRGYEPHSHLPACRHLRLDSAVSVISGGVRYDTPGRGEPLVFQRATEVGLLGKVVAKVRVMRRSWKEGRHALAARS